MIHTAANTTAITITVNNDNQIEEIEKISI